MNISEWSQSHRPRIGTLLTIDHPAVIEVAALAGFDWLWVDAEHGRFNETSAALAAALCAGGPPVLVRLPDFSPTAIKRYLDAGCDGIILPQVSTLEDVNKIARAALYPPKGERSVGIARAQGYGTKFESCLREKNYALVVQIETRAGVENARDLVSHPAVDAVILGPYDLSGSCGVPGQVDAAEVVNGIVKVQTLCREFKKPCGIFAATAENAHRYAQQGFDLVAVGMDTTALLSAYQSIRNALR